jgi:T5SS/PEP-CTERM-associated repeat protein
VSAFEPSFLEIKGGVVDAQSVRIGGEAGEQGRLRLDTTRFSSATLALIGDDGRGQVDIERAIFRGVDVRLARNVFADGFVTVNGVDAQLEIDASLIVAERGSASLAIEENGELRLNNEAEFTIGMHGGASGSSGRVVVSDAGRITGASVVTLGEESGARGELEIFGADSSAVVTLMFVGQAGEGSVAVADGGFLKSDQLRMALDQGARATVEVIGAGPADEETAIEIERFTTVGEAGPETAALSIRNGGFINGGIGGGDTVASTIAANPGSRGIVTVEGNGSVWQTRVLNVGFAGTADLFIRDQAFVKSDDAVVGNVAGAIGDVEIVGDATWEVDGILDVAPAGIGRIQVRAGGFLNANELIAGPLAVVTVDGIAVGPGDDTAARRFRQAQFANPSGIRTDRLVIAEGAEIIADTIALRAGGELAGDGTLDVDLTNSGTMTPGVDECSAGTFNINGNYAQAPDATLRIKLGGTRPGSAHDVLDVAGQATLAGTLHVDAFDGFRPREDQSFEILTAGSINGEFDAIAGSGEYVASYETNRVILTVLASPTEIGEPCPKENTCGAGAPCGAMGGICMWAAFAGLGGLRVRRSGVGPLSR